MLNIHFAPIQGYTDSEYRNLHHKLVDGVKSYMTPFIRCDKGELRNKDIRDILPENNVGIPLIPQLIAANKDELCTLTDLILKNHYTAICINMGCSFPLQTRIGRGAGILPRIEMVQEVLDAAASYPDVEWIVKMRLGMDLPDECMAILPLLNDAPLRHIILHPRSGRMSMRGTCDKEAFRAFRESSKHPVMWNGDITTIEQIHELEKEFPDLPGVMIGRGLLACPTIAREYAEGKEWPDEERRKVALDMHDQLFDIFSQTLQGQAQLLARMQSYWEYQTTIFPRKIYKGLMKAKNIFTYKDALAEAKSL